MARFIADRSLCGAPLDRWNSAQLRRPGRGRLGPPDLPYDLWIATSPSLPLGVLAMTIPSKRVLL